ncbi:hypothetical protein EXS70_01220 [Candidatus Peribacteria bacterium]|nr:hypothetical protein [Candidatus Peribacteria bacterium]
MKTREIRIPAGEHTPDPVHIRWEFPDCGAETKLSLHVGSGARVMVIEELATGSGPGSEWSHAVEVHLEEGADVEFVSEQIADASVHLTLSQRSHLGDNAKISWRNVTLGGKNVEHELTSELTGADAVSTIDWMFYAKNEEKYQLNARNIFTGRHGSGEITMKGVAEGKGHVQCNGKIEIGVGGGETDTYLTQDVLMLDKTAKVDAIPGLEIKTNDVKASHSATVSRVTEEDLFYFAARGIIEKEARRMFVEGFLGEMVGKIGSQTAREEILASVEGKYGI